MNILKGNRLCRFYEVYLNKEHMFKEASWKVNAWNIFYKYLIPAFIECLYVQVMLLVPRQE